MSINITVKGNVGRDPEFKVGKSGTQVCSFSLAYTQRKKVGNEWQEGETMWFRVIQFGEKAEQLADLVSAGDAVVVVGSLGQNSYEAKDGSQKTALEIIATDVALLPKKAKRKDKDPEW